MKVARTVSEERGGVVTFPLDSNMLEAPVIIAQRDLTVGVVTNTLLSQ